MIHKKILIISSLSAILLLIVVVGMSVLSRRANNVSSPPLIRPTIPAPTITSTATQRISPSVEPEISVSRTVYSDNLEQLQHDAEFAEDAKQVYDEFPWLNKLPLQGNDYYIYFDIEDKVFYGFVYDKNNILEIQNTVIAELNANNLPYDRYEIIWK